MLMVVTMAIHVIEATGGPTAQKQHQKGRAKRTYGLGEGHRVEHVGSNAKSLVAGMYCVPSAQGKV